MILFICPLGNIMEFKTSYQMLVIMVNIYIKLKWSSSIIDNLYFEGISINNICLKWKMCTKLKGWQIWNLDPSSKS
jgi:hypothetical protein